MSDNDNYWSDENESENELIQDSRDLPPLEYDSEEEEEFLNILNLVSNKIKDKEDIPFFIKNNIQEKQPKKKNSKKKNSKKNILFDFSSEEKSEKKVWRSKRMRDKKGPEIIKRKFNPRLPPPGNKFKNIKIKQNIKINLELDFPSL